MITDIKPFLQPKNIFNLIKKMLFLAIGAFTAGFAIEGFLVPNQMIDGGVVGVSMILSHIFNYNLGLLIVILNIPFVCLALTKMGKQFVLQTFFAIAMLGIATNLFHHLPVTEDHLLATVFGGMILGLGVGIVLKNEGSLDGTEIMSLVLSKKFGLSVGEIIMAFNIFIYGASGLVFGWEQAMYSILTYFVAYRVIDVVIDGLDTSKSVRIISNKSEEIGKVLVEDLEIGITYLYGKGGYSGIDKTVIYCVVSRLEMSKLKEAVRRIDPTAFLSVVDVHEVYGTRMKKRIDKI